MQMGYYNSSVHHYYSNNMKHDQFSTYSMSMRLLLSHTLNSSSCVVMNLPHRGGANLLVSRSEGNLCNILR